MKSFRLPHTRPFLPHFAEAKKTISRGAKSAPKKETPYMENLLSTLFYFPLIDVFSFTHYSCKLLKIEGRKKGKYVVVGRINESYG